MEFQVVTANRMGGILTREEEKKKNRNRGKIVQKAASFGRKESREKIFREARLVGNVLQFCAMQSGERSMAHAAARHSLVRTYVHLVEKSLCTPNACY